MGIPAPSSSSAALVTGASSGIGEALARGLAQRGHHVVLVARRRERLEKLAAELREKHGVRAEVLTCDLAEAADRARMLGELVALRLDVDVVVLNAGFGMVGPFVENSEDRIATMVRTNVESTMTLARALTPAMVARRRGAVLFVSSMAGNQPMPFFAPYAATKAAITSLGEALHCELKPHGVTVSVLAPASVATEFSDVAEAAEQAKRQPKFMTATAEQCADAGLAALDAGKRRVCPLPQARAFAWIAEHTPKAVWLPISRMMLR
jgi:short-subunit dehydrogenase